MKFKNVEDWADYNRLLPYLGYGDHNRVDIEAYIREDYFNPDLMILEMKKGRVEHREPMKLYDWEEIL